MTDDMSQRLNAIIPDDVHESLIEIAKNENRTKSQMTGILLQLGIEAYLQKKNPSKAQGG